jgi:hypothetical protein
MTPLIAIHRGIGQRDEQGMASNTPHLAMCAAKMTRTNSRDGYLTVSPDHKTRQDDQRET